LLKQNIKTDGLNLIISDIGKDNNFENYSKVYADDVLVSILKKVDALDMNDKLNIFKLVGEQLTDMFNFGRCPSGRVTRLIQIYKSL
jgi:hypothetical protein